MKSICLYQTKVIHIFIHRVTPYRLNKFANSFKTSGVQFITVRGNHFVLINSMALEGDGCFMCKPAELQLINIESELELLFK